MDIFSKAISKLTDKAWRLDGEIPTTEAAFLAQFKIGMGLDETGSQIYSPDPANFGFAWEELKEVMEIEGFRSAKEASLSTLDIEFEKQVVELTGNKPSVEREMWMLINLNAQKFLAGDETKREFLEGQVPPVKKAELTQAGEDVAAWKANDALKKEKITSKVVELAMGIKKTAEEAIEAASTIEELNITIKALKDQEKTVIEKFKTSLGGGT